MEMAIQEGEKVEASPGGRAWCPGCGGEMVAKCGELITWHWAHKSGDDCDTWAEGETAWHSGWKAQFPKEWREVQIGNHRADVQTGNGIVLEFQHSPLRAEEAREREVHYQQLVWVLDVTPLKSLQLSEASAMGGLTTAARMELPRLVQVINLNRWSWATDTGQESVAIYLDNGGPSLYQLYGRNEALVVERDHFIQYMKALENGQRVRVHDPKAWDREKTRQTEEREEEKRKRKEVFELWQWEIAADAERKRLERDATERAGLAVYASLWPLAMVVGLNNAVDLFKTAIRAQAVAQHERLLVEARRRLQARSKWVGSLKDRILEFTEFNERLVAPQRGPEHREAFLGERAEERAVNFCKYYALDPDEQIEFYATFRESQGRISQLFDRFGTTPA